MAKVQIVFYSMYGHVYQLAEAVAEGARKVSDTEVSLFQVPELMSDEALEKSGAKDAREAFADIPVAEQAQLAEADAIIFGTPTRFGNSVFASTGTQHGGQETTITSFHSTLLHHGMIIVGVPYTVQELTNMEEITGGTPYGATTLAGADGSRRPTENELAIARFQGKHVAQIARKLCS